MKKTILLALALIVSIFLICAFTPAHAQVTKTAQGNYIQSKKVADSSKAVSTGKTFTDNKGNVYPVLQGAKGGLYYLKTSKAGNVYKAYIKVS